MKYQVKDIKNFPGYRIDTNGDVWSCKKQVHKKDNRGMVTEFTNIFLKLVQRPNKGGYQCVHLRNDGKSFLKTVHGLVLENFKCKREGGLQCRHLDGDKLNNKLNNLKWGTAIENHNDKRLHGTTAYGENNANSKLNKFQVQRIRLMKEVDPKIKLTVIARMFNLDKTTIWDIVHRRSWRHIE